MKIDLILRSQSPMLLDRMISSAKKMASGPFGILVEEDHDQCVELAATYNRLIAKSDADIVCIMHDDVEFLSKNWDQEVRDLFIEYHPDILGVVGSSRYEGGKHFDSGWQYGLGHYVTEIDGKDFVKVFSKRARYAKAAVLDGMLMFTSRKHLEKEPFDEKFDGLFFLDIDFCLRAPKVAVTSNILVKHCKPKELYGKYPEKMKPEADYWEMFHVKHGLSPAPVRDQTCACISLDNFKKLGQNTIYDEFIRKFKVATCVSQQ